MNDINMGKKIIYFSVFNNGTNKNFTMWIHEKELESM